MNLRAQHYSKSVTFLFTLTQIKEQEKERKLHTKYMIPIHF